MWKVSNAYLKPETADRIHTPPSDRVATVVKTLNLLMGDGAIVKFKLLGQLKSFHHNPILSVKFCCKPLGKEKKINEDLVNQVLKGLGSW